MRLDFVNKFLNGSPVDQESWAQDEALVAAAKRIGAKPREVVEVWTGSEGYLRIKTIDNAITVIVPDDEPDANRNCGPLVDPTSPSKPTRSVPVYAPFEGARPKGPDAEKVRQDLEDRREFVAGHLDATRTELEAFRQEHLRGHDGRSSVTDALKAQERALEGVVRAWGDELDEIDATLNPRRPDESFLALHRGAFLWSLAETDDEIARVVAAYPVTRYWSRSPAMIANERKGAEAILTKWGIPLPTLDEVPALVVQGATPRPRTYNQPAPEPGAVL